MVAKINESIDYSQEGLKAIKDRIVDIVGPEKATTPEIDFAPQANEKVVGQKSNHLSVSSRKGTQCV